MDGLGNANVHLRGQPMGQGSSCLKRSTSGAFEFLTLSQTLLRPDRYGCRRCFETISWHPNLQACVKTAAPSSEAAMCGTHQLARLNATWKLQPLRAAGVSFSSLGSFSAQWPDQMTFKGV